MRVSTKASRFTDSVIREMTRVSMHCGCVNLAQGFPDFSAPKTEFSLRPAREIGVAVAPCSGFFSPGREEGRRRVRFCFSKRLETLAAAGERLEKLRKPR